MAQASAGEVFFVTKSRTGDAIPPGDPGIFQNPFTLPNIWRQMELPNLQRNRAITAITNVVVEENFRRYTDWRQGDGNLFQLPSLDPSNPPPMNPVKKRDVSGAACSVQASTITKAPSTSTTAADAIRPGPTLSCLLHNQDPDQGILQAYCLCNGSITLAPLPATSAQSESCAYSTMPGTSASEAVTTQTQVWTTNCQACTIVGGVADQETCTPVSGCKPTSAPVPTIAAWIGNLSTIDIGNAEDGNGGKDLAQEMFTKLKGSCDASNRTCKSTPAVMDNVEAVLLDGEEPLKPAMYFQDAVFTTPAILDQMLSVGISSWIAALNNQDLGLCKDVEYEADADETGSGCGKGPISPGRLRRKIRRDSRAVLWERGGLPAEEHALEQRCNGDCDSHPQICHYEARMCSAPNEITVVMAGAGDPYANHLNIGITLEATSDGFPCEEIAEALTAVMVIIAPELIGADAFEGVELEAICGLVNDPWGAISGLTDTLKVG